MYRRKILGILVLGGGLSGCLGDEGGGFGSNDDSPEETDEADDDTTTDGDDDTTAELREGFEEAGINVLEIEIENETIYLEAQTSGNVDTDIRDIAGAYASLSETVEKDLSVRIEDRGLTEETFEIELEWARAFLNDELSDEEYLEKINETTI